VYIVVAWAWGPTLSILLKIGIPLVIFGTAGFLAGITYPGVQARVAAFRRRRQHQRHYRELNPLWTLLVAAYPKIVLRAAPPRALDLLRPRPKRPGRRAAEKRDELAASHSITSSASESRLSGIVTPSALAVLRLITSSYLVGACTGRSAGFSPLRMRSM